MCSPQKARLIRLAIALADADDNVLSQVEALLSGGQSNWQRLVGACHLKEACEAFNPERFPLESNPTPEGIREVLYTGKCDKTGQQILDKALLHSNPVEVGSAMLYISANKHKGSKLVITGCTWSGEDGHTYVMVYDKVASAIQAELIDELDCSFTFLVR